MHWEDAQTLPEQRKKVEQSKNEIQLESKGIIPGMAPPREEPGRCIFDCEYV
jgi:hypothetical protein